MNQRKWDFLPLTLLLLLLTAYFVAGWKASPCAGSILSALGAVVVILLIGRILYVINRKMLTGSSLLPPLFYAFLATAHPAAFCFSTLHIAALLLAVSLYSYLCFNALAPSMSRLASMWLTLGCAGLLLPALLWLAPVYAITSVSKADDKLKFWFITLFGLAIPTATWLVITYLMGDTTPASEIFVHDWEEMTAIHHPTFYHSTPALCRILIVAVVSLVAMGGIFSRLSTYKTSQFHACLRLIVLTLCLGVLALIFWGDTATPAGLMVMAPASLLLGLYFETTRNKKASRTLLVILTLILVFERISHFV